MSQNISTENMMEDKVAIKKKTSNKPKIFFMLICTLPVLIIYLLLKIYPLIDMFITSFFDWRSIFAEKIFVGFSNYSMLLSSKLFWDSFLNTIFYIFLSTLFTVGLALLFATMLSKGRIKGKAYYRVMFYIPNILSIIVIGIMFGVVFKTPDGVFNSLFMNLGFIDSPTNFLGVAESARWSILIVMVWQAVGYYMVMYIAGMDAIPNSLYESADLEGAGAVRKFFVITVPLAWEVIRVTFTFFVISSINVSFLITTAMIPSDGGITGANNLLSFMDLEMNKYNYGVGMTVGTLLFLFSFVFTLIIQRLTKRDVVQY